MRRVLLVVDSHKWCFGHMARGIQKYAPKDYAVSVLDGTEFCVAQKIDPDWHQRFDAICQFSWTEANYTVPIRNVVVVAHEGCMHPYPMPPDSGVLDSLTTPLRNRKRADELLPRADHVLFFTEKMRNAFPQIVGSVPRLAVDTEIFCVDLSKKRHSPFRIGWCAQRNVRHKGGELLQEVIDLLDGSLYEFDVLDLRATDANVKTQQEMAGWYRSLDAFLCTAASEGGPMTVLEAAACGVPVVSTGAGVSGSVAHFGPDEEAAEIADSVEIFKRTTDNSYDRFSAHAAVSVRSWETESENWIKEILGESI